MERKCELKWEILSIINWGLLGILLTFYVHTEKLT